MNDMGAAIIPKSDQINADDLIAGPMTITITEVKISGGTEQPVSMGFAGSNKAYRPCKSMCRVMVSAWGPDANQYKGRSLTLYCDPSVKWGGMAVGGIRISHMSHINGPLNMMLTATKGSRKAYTVQPLVLGHSAAKPERTRTQMIADIKTLARDIGMPESDVDKDLKSAGFIKPSDIPLDWLLDYETRLRASV